MSEYPRNILYLSTFGNLRWGGQKSLFHLVTRLDKDKYRPCVVLPTDEDFAEVLRKKDTEFVIYPLPPVNVLNPFQFLSTVRFLIELIDDKEIALIHTDGPRNTFYAGLAAKVKHRPLVWHIRSSEKDRYDPLLVPLCTKIILVANALRRRFSWSRNDQKFTTIYNGVDLGEFGGTVSTCNSFKAEHDVDGSVILIGSFARIEAMKGQRALIEACARLRDAFPFNLCLYGEIHDQDYYHTCLKTIEKLDLQANVFFGNHQKDIASVMNKMDIVVLNSTFAEAFPRSIIEAMAAAKPVVVSNIGGSAEAVEEGRSGFIVMPGNTEMLADRLTRLGRDRELRRKFGEAARQRVETLFTIEENVRKTEQVYKELFGNEIS